MNPSVISLFSGCGGLDLGFKRAGFSVAMAADNDPRCIASHQKNFPGVPLFPGSVADLDCKTLEALLADSRKDQPRVLIGGPPCPPFSKSRFYRKEKKRALEDPVGLETVTAYLRILEETRPDAFLLENVPGFAYGIHRDALEWVLARAHGAGFRCAWAVINAADYGVPQIRERFFLVGMRGKEFQFPAPSHRSPAVDPDLFSSGLPVWRTAGEVLCDLDTDAKGDDKGHFAGGKHNDLLRLVPPGDNYLFFTTERGHPEPLFRWRSRYWSFLLKLSPDKPSWTIQARRSNNMGPFHWRNRILRVSEIKRIQTFPDRWFLAGNVEQQWRQVGNAVPPLLAFQLASALRLQLGLSPGPRNPRL